MKKSRLLIVDDEAYITRELKDQLEHTGRFEVLAANSGASALRAVRRFKPDMAILDVMMDGMDGGELKFRLQQIPGFKHLPVAFLTAAKLPNEKNDKELFIEKPVEIQHIIDVIDQQLLERAAPNTGRPASA